VLTSPTALDLNFRLFILFSAVEEINPKLDRFFFGCVCGGGGGGSFLGTKKKKKKTNQKKEKSK